MGGADRVATWLHVPSSEIDGMRRRGHVDRGWFAHFYVTLTALGHAPAPKLFGLKSWRAVTMQGVRRALQRPYHDLQLSPCYRCCIGPRLSRGNFPITVGRMCPRASRTLMRGTRRGGTT